MTIRRTPRPRDPVQLGKLIVDIATRQAPDKIDDGKSAAASELGKKGGRARANAMSAERRAEIARKGAQRRWKQKTGR